MDDEDSVEAESVQGSGNSWPGGKIESSVGDDAWETSRQLPEDEEFQHIMPTRLSAMPQHNMGATRATALAAGGASSDWSAMCMQRLEERLESGRLQLQRQLDRLELRLQQHVIQVNRQQLLSPRMMNNMTAPGGAHWAELAGQVDSLHGTVQMLLRRHEPAAAVGGPIWPPTPAEPPAAQGREGGESLAAACSSLGWATLAGRVDSIAEEVAALAPRIGELESTMEGGGRAPSEAFSLLPAAAEPGGHTQQLEQLEFRVADLDQRWQSFFVNWEWEVLELRSLIAELQGCFQVPEEGFDAADVELVFEGHTTGHPWGMAAADPADVTTVELTRKQGCLQEQMAHTLQQVAELEARTADVQHSLHDASVMQDIHHRVLRIGNRIRHLRRRREDDAAFATTSELQQLREVVDALGEQVATLMGHVQATQERRSPTLAEGVEPHPAEEEEAASGLRQGGNNERQLAPLQQAGGRAAPAAAPAALPPSAVPELDLNAFLTTQMAELEARIAATENTLSDLAAYVGAVDTANPKATPETTALGEQLAALASRMQTAEASLQDLAADVGSSKERLPQVAELASRMQSAEGTLVDLSTELGSAKENLLQIDAGLRAQLHEEQAKELQEHRTGMEEVREQLQTALQTQQEQGELWPGNVQKLEGQLQGVVEGLDESLSVISDLRQQVFVADKRLRQLEDSASRTGKLSDLEAAVGGLREKHQGLLVSLREGVGMLYRRLDEQVDGLGGRIDKLHRQANCASAELKLLHTQHSELSAKFSTMERSIKASGLNNLKPQVDGLQAQFRKLALDPSDGIGQLAKALERTTVVEKRQARVQAHHTEALAAVESRVDGVSERLADVLSRLLDVESHFKAVTKSGVAMRLRFEQLQDSIDERMRRRPSVAQDPAGIPAVPGELPWASGREPLTDRPSIRDGRGEQQLQRPAAAAAVAQLQRGAATQENDGSTSSGA